MIEWYRSPLDWHNHGEIYGGIVVAYGTMMVLTIIAAMFVGWLLLIASLLPIISCLEYSNRNLRGRRASVPIAFGFDGDQLLIDRSYFKYGSNVQTIKLIHMNWLQINSKVPKRKQGYWERVGKNSSYSQKFIGSCVEFSYNDRAAKVLFAGGTVDIKTENFAELVGRLASLDGIGLRIDKEPVSKAEFLAALQSELAS